MDRQATYRKLEEIYNDLELELGELQPKCQLSSRCCKFKEFGHELRMTRLEYDYLVEHEGEPQQTVSGVCPYLENGLCGVREHRMLGCRVFFCDENYKSIMNSIYEKYHRKIKALHVQSGYVFQYSDFLEFETPE